MAKPTFEVCPCGYSSDTCHIVGGVERRMEPARRGGNYMVAEPGQGRQGGMVRVLEVDPDLMEDLDPARAAVAKVRAVAPAMVLRRGRWDPSATHPDST